MSDTIKNCDVYTNSATFRVALTPASSRRNRVDLQANVDPDTGRVTFFVPLDEIDTLRS